MQKNKLLIFAGTLFVVLVFLFSFMAGSYQSSTDGSEDILTKATNESKLITSDVKKEFTRISVDEYLDFYNGSDDMLVLVGRSGCHYCQIAEPIIQNLMFIYNLDIKYVSTDDFDIDSEEKFMSSNEQLHSFSTPLLMVVSNGSIKYIQNGLLDTAGYVNFLQVNGYIEK